MPQVQPQPTSPLARRIIKRVINTIRGGRAPRVASVALGVPPDVDPMKTTAGDGQRLDRRAKAERIGSMLDPGERSRRQRYLDYREMKVEVPELHRSLAVLIDFIFGGELDSNDPQSFDVHFAEGARDEVKLVVDQVISDLDLQRTIRAIVTEGVWLGDSFTELVYTDRALVGQLPLLPEGVTVMEIFGFVLHYLVTIGSSTTALALGTSLANARNLHPYQVLHYAPDRPRGSRYGESIWLSARKRWRTAEAVEDVLGLMALVNPRGRRTVLWPFPDDQAEDEIWAWLREIEVQTEDDLVFDVDGNVQRKVVPQLETADRNLPFKVYEGMENQSQPTIHQGVAAPLEQLIRVLEFFQDSYFIAGGTPAALAGMERNVNAKSTLVVQMTAFALSVRNRQSQAAMLTVDIITRGLLAADIIPEKDEFSIELAAPTQFNELSKAEILKTKSEAAKNLAAAGFSAPFIAKVALGIDDEDELADVIAAASVINVVDVEEMVKAWAERQSPVSGVAGVRVGADGETTWAR